MHSHIHSGLPRAAMVHKVRKEVKEKATYDHFKSAAAIAEEVVSSRVGNNPTPALPSINSLASCANRLRKKMRPPEPQDLDFQLDEDYIPRGFFKCDVKVDNKRHLIFATDQQLALLSSAKS